MLGLPLAQQGPAPSRPNDLAAIERTLALLEGERGEGVRSAVRCDLAYSLAELARGARTRATTRLEPVGSPWELGLERCGDELVVTVFRGGPSPEVAVFERRLPFARAAARVLSSLAELAPEPLPSNDAEPDAVTPLAPFVSPLFDVPRPRRLAPVAEPRFVAPLRGEAEACAHAELAAALDSALAPSPVTTVPVSIEAPADAPFSIAAELTLRVASGAARADAVARSDLFALLFRGRVRITAFEAEREIDGVFVFPFVEQLVSLAADAVDAWAQGRGLHRRFEATGMLAGLRLTPAGVVSLTVGKARSPLSERTESWTFPGIDVVALAEGVLTFGRAVLRAVVRRDRAQSQNLRLAALRTSLRELDEHLREAREDGAMVNATPNAYRAFAIAPVPKPEPDAFGHARLRFAAKWLAEVPALDLRSTFLCGDALVLGSATQTTVLHRATGEIVWQRELPRAVSVPTPAGLARLGSDGSVTLHDLATGDAVYQVRLAPRVGTAASGAVVSGPGLPRLFLVSEGKNHLCAIDLDAGEVRWRYAARRGHSFRLRRAGRLVVVASGDAALVALDVVTGELVWRYCDRLGFAGHVAFDRDALFVVAGHGGAGVRGGSRLHHLDPWSGAGRWRRELPARMVPTGAPLLTPHAVILASRERGGTTLAAFDRATGEPLWERPASLAPASCLVVDDLVVLNGEDGVLVAVDAGTGALRYRHVFAGEADGDRPRRLEPVLRSGALFVPQKDVHVVRPRDGALLGTVAADLVPDLLRVDEKCNVYVAEESGHVAAFGAAPRLALVK